MSNTLTLNTDVSDLEPSEVAELRSIIDDFMTGVTTPAEDLGDGWTPTRILALLSALEKSRGGHQASVIRKAAELGGSIDRATVYEVCGYGDTRSLKGFTRPVNRVVHELKTSGVLPATISSPLKPIYNEEIASFQQAKGFTLPDDLVAALGAA